MTKLESLQKLRAYEYNVADFVETDEALSVQDLRKRFGKKRLAVRCSKEGSFHLPFEIYLPFEIDLPPGKALTHVRRLKNLGYTPFICEYLEVQSPTLYQGRVLLRFGGSGMVDVYRGGTTLRRAEKDNIPVYSKVFDHWGYCRETPLLQVDLIGDVLSELRVLPVLLGPGYTEWSYHMKPVGTQKKRLVLWEFIPSPNGRD